MSKLIRLGSVIAEIEKMFMEYWNAHSDRQILEDEQFIILARDKFVNYYKESSLEGIINYDEIIIKCSVLGRVSNRGKVGGVDLVYGNLYSFVLADGIVIPYNEWLFEDKFTCTLDTGDNIEYSIDKHGAGKKDIMSVTLTADNWVDPL